MINIRSLIFGFMGLPTLALQFTHGQQPADFEKNVAPLLIKHCVECHNSQDRNGGLDLSTEAGFNAGGESEIGLADPELDDNLLLERVRSGEMPPPERGVSRKLPSKEIAKLGDWIRNGSHWPANRRLDLYEFTNEVRGGRDWWSFQPIQRPSVPLHPMVRGSAQTNLNRTSLGSGEEIAANPIDAFIAEKHRLGQLDFAPAASPEKIFRRLHYDVTGLPPDPEESVQFANNDSADKYARLVDRLISSPRFGEQQARDWLDLVRYGDTNGYERDAEKPHAWKYRDWVIEAINADMPYDRFVTGQLAGDQVQPLSERNVIATTMLRLGTWDDEPNDKLEYKYDRLEDLVHVTSTAFLGLTVKCARCHNHKFDPIPQTDYYRFAAIFWPGDLIGNSSKKVKGFDTFGWTDTTSEPSPIHLLLKGNPRDPGAVVQPGYLSVTARLDTPFETESLVDTGRRLEFARRLVDRRNPLTARVIVNRIWQHYFGHGLVRSVNNFGYKGERPSHPKLLDWLASELIANDWNLKPIHRLILMSRTYRQDSANPKSESYADIDPLNRLLWRMNRRRLRAEAIRDSMLARSGQLSMVMGGRGFTPDVSDAALEGLSRQSQAWNPSSPEQRARRGVYMFVRRSLIPPLIAAFDFADTTRPCGKRDVTIVAPQALALLNNEFVHRQSELLAARVRKRVAPKLSTADKQSQSSVPSNLEATVKVAWKIALGRLPDPHELALSKAYLTKQSALFQREQALEREHNKRSLLQSGRTSNESRDIPRSALKLHLKASAGVELDSQQRVVRWTDTKSKQTFVPPSADRAPRLQMDAIDGRPGIRFDGTNQSLSLDEQVIESPEFTIVVVGSDENRSGHREFFSNWNSDGNSTSSVFLGLTDGRKVRFSDQLKTSAAAPTGPLVLTALSDSNKASVLVGSSPIGSRNGGLTQRNLKPPYVLGTQGNYGHEYLKGTISELLVFDRALSKVELKSLVRHLEDNYPSTRTAALYQPPSPERTPDFLALASLCHALLNSNEFIFVD